MRFTKIRLYEPRSVTTTLGGYAGPTIRLGQGMSFRVGGFASRSTSHDEVQPIDSGVLILTTKRLVFVGPQRNASIDLTKIVAVQPYGDAIRVATTGRQKPQYYVGLGPKCLNMNLTVNGRSYHEPISGPILHMIIEALAQRLR